MYNVPRYLLDAFASRTCVNFRFLNTILRVNRANHSIWSFKLLIHCKLYIKNSRVIIESSLLFRIVLNGLKKATLNCFCLTNRGHSFNLLSEPRLIRLLLFRQSSNKKVINLSPTATLNKSKRVNNETYP